jgi:hypothetical protein
VRSWKRIKQDFSFYVHVLDGKFSRNPGSSSWYDAALLPSSSFSSLSKGQHYAAIHNAPEWRQHQEVPLRDFLKPIAYPNEGHAELMNRQTALLGEIVPTHKAPAGRIESRLRFPECEARSSKNNWQAQNRSQQIPSYGGAGHEQHLIAAQQYMSQVQNRGQERLMNQCRRL